jgi:DNA-binding NarL/FixJ family response regulator
MRNIDTIRPHERRVLQALADGRTEREAASELGLAHQTVRSYVKTARTRLGAVNTPQAVATAIREGLIT